MGFRFKPWTDPKTIADGPSIIRYLKEAVEENNLEEKFNFKRKLSQLLGTQMMLYGL